MKKIQKEERKDITCWTVAKAVAIMLVLVTVIKREIIETERKKNTQYSFLILSNHKRLEQFIIFV